MPIYEYACKKCNSEFELLIRGDQSPECPGCGSRKLEKLLSVPAAHMASGGQLPVCSVSPPGGCGSATCGMGRCSMEP